MASNEERKTAWLLWAHAHPAFDYSEYQTGFYGGWDTRDAEVQQLRKEVEALTEAALDHRATASRALEERDRLGDALYAAYVATGADADGAQDWRQLFLPITSPSWTAVITDEINQLRVDADSDVARAEAERDRYAAVIEKVSKYAEDRALYGKRDRTVGSMRIASDLQDILTSIDSGSALAEVKAQALEDAAQPFMDHLPDGTGNGRAYNSYRVAEMLRDRAEQIRKEGQ